MTDVKEYYGILVGIDNFMNITLKKKDNKIIIVKGHSIKFIFKLD